MLEIIAAALGALLIAVVLIDAFETIILPRRIARQVTLTRFFFRSIWLPWRSFAAVVPPNGRESYLAVFGPLSLLLLIALWAALIALGFGLLIWGAGNAATPSGSEAGFGSTLYMSATTFFTLGIGDVQPDSALARLFVAIESGSGLGFFALVVTYLPVLYQAFSRREVNVSLLDARAGSPPSAGEFFRRFGTLGGKDQLDAFLLDWERWAAELLETHLSYPVLMLYRSQHERQSWLAALTFILDVSSLVLACAAKERRDKARLTFAMARHAAIDLSQVLYASPGPGVDRLSRDDFQSLVKAADPLLGAVRWDDLAELRRSYEPNLHVLSRFLLMPLPSWLPTEAQDAWASSPWQ